MGHLLILKKDSRIAADFKNPELFASYTCAALHEDAQHYYVTLITNDPLSDSLLERWQPSLLSRLDDIHGSLRCAITGASYQCLLKQYPITDMEAVKRFYHKHHRADFDEFMLNYCRRTIDFDFIDEAHQSLFVFSKNKIAAQPMPPIESFPGAEKYPEFIADLHQLVTLHLKSPVSLTLLSLIDNQKTILERSLSLFGQQKDLLSVEAKQETSISNNAKL